MEVNIKADLEKEVVRYINANSKPGQTLTNHEAIASLIQIGLRTSPNGERKRIITNVQDYLSHVLHLHKLDPAARVYYRGEADRGSATCLIPGLNRPHNFEVLSKAYDKATPEALQRAIVHMLVRYAEQFRPDISPHITPRDYLSWTCVAQHHRLPTLLLDWSINALTGLFFACDDSEWDTAEHNALDKVFDIIDDFTPFLRSEGTLQSDMISSGLTLSAITEKALRMKHQVNRNKDGVVWRMKLRHANEREHLTIHLEELMFKQVDVISKFKTGTQEDLFQQLENGFAVPSPIVIVPRMLTRRIESQAGRFIFSSSKLPLHQLNHSVGIDNRHALPWKDEIEDIAIIPHDSKKSIIQDLASMRIHSGSMYADLDGYAKFLKSGFR